MIGKPDFGQVFNVHPVRKQRVAAALGLLLGLSLLCFDVQAALFFRGVEQVNGEQRWSPIKEYSKPSDTAYARASASGAGAPVEEVRVFLVGEITPADVASVAVMEGLLKSGKQKIAGNSVWLASNGGDIDAGMEVGRRLRKLGVFTVIAKEDQCLSACVFAFMGGERRSVAGQLGIHRPYFPFTEGTPERRAQFHNLEKILKDFVAELDFPDSLYEAVMQVPPESMQILTAVDLKRFYLEGISPATEDMIDAAAARRLKLTMFEYLTRKAQAPACAFFDAGPGRCEGKVKAAAASGGAADDPELAQTGEAAAADPVDAIPSKAILRLKKPQAVKSRGPI